MNQRAKLGAIFLVAFLLLAGARPFPGQNAQPAQKDLEAIAREFANEFFLRQFDKAVARFDANMTKFLPPEKMAEFHDALSAQMGAFKRLVAARRETVQSFQAIRLTCEFEKAKLDLRVVFNAEGQISGMFFLPASDVAWKAPDYADETKFTEREVTVGRAPWTLPGTLTLPKSGGRLPAVVLVHGSGPQDADETIGPNKPFKDLAWGLANRGVAVLRYEKRTHKYGKEIAAQMQNLTMNEETVVDAQEAVKLLATLPEIDPRRIFVLGHSLGAYVGPRIAAGAPVAGLILAAGNTRPLEVLVVEQVRYLTSLDGKVTPEEQKQLDAAEQSAKEIQSPDLKPGTTVSLLGSPVPASYFLDLRNYRPAEAAAALKIPILVVQGERDYQVTLLDFEGWKKALGTKPNVTLKMYPGLNHLFAAGSGPSSGAEYMQAGHVSAEVIFDIAGWIAAQSNK